MINLSFGVITANFRVSNVPGILWLSQNGSYKCYYWQVENTPFIVVIKILQQQDNILKLNNHGEVLFS